MKIDSIVPYLSIKGAKKAVEFYSSVFECKPYVQLDMPDGRLMHCEYRFGSIKFFVSEELPEHGGTASPVSLRATTVAIHIYVDDCDTLIGKFKENGADILMSPSDMFWGERFGRVRDPFGHEWGIATVLKEMTAEEINEQANKIFEES